VVALKKTAGIVYVRDASGLILLGYSHTWPIIICYNIWTWVRCFHKMNGPDFKGPLGSSSFIYN
jgi:hypothetical protein